MRRLALTALLLLSACSADGLDQVVVSGTPSTSVVELSVGPAVPVLRAFPVSTTTAIPHSHTRARRAPTGGNAANRALGRQMAAEHGWTGEQWTCLDILWTHESGWNHTADNPSSSAYGIPQALPGSKMASHGDDWATNPATQIRWGLTYVRVRYGTPCAALRHSYNTAKPGETFGWY